MVNKEIINDKEYWQCGICKFYYAEKKWSKKCQKWCEKHNSCNMEITKHAVNPKESKGCC